MNKNNIIKLIVYKKVNRKIVSNILFQDNYLNSLPINSDDNDELIKNIDSYLEQNINDYVIITDYDNNMSYVYLSNNDHTYLIIINNMISTKINNIYPVLTELITDISQLYSENGTNYLSLIHDLIHTTNINLSDKSNQESNSDLNLDLDTESKNTLTMINTIETIKQNVRSTITNLKNADNTIDRLDQKTDLSLSSSSTGNKIIKSINGCIIM